jgi:hypothetical protein
MEAEAVKTVLYLLLVLGGGVMVGAGNSFYHFNRYIRCMACHSDLVAQEPQAAAYVERSH